MATPEQGGDWGILGGTFDPVHLGHISLARQLAEHASLDGVLFVLAAAHPFKGPTIHAPYEFRRDMLELGLAGQPNFLLSEVEKDLDLSGYTYDTIRALKVAYPIACFTFLIGSDNLISLAKWHRIDEVLSEVRFTVGTRPPADSLIVPEPFRDRVDAFDIEPIDISSTHIRERVAAGVDLDALAGLVPRRVAEYILRNGLYQ